MTFTYRTQPDSPPDVQTIQKQMAIVAWQPGPNKVVQVPSEVRCWGRAALLSACWAWAWAPRCSLGCRVCLGVAAQDEVRSLQPGEVRERTPARPPARPLSPLRYKPAPGFAPRSGGREAAPNKASAVRGVSVSALEKSCCFCDQL